MNVAEENQAQQQKRQAIQAIMRDGSLTAQEKQKKIQQLMATGSQAGSTGIAPASVPPIAAAPAPQPVMTQPPVQPVMTSPPAAPVAVAGTHPASSPRVGAMRSTGVDPAANKGARTSSGMTASAAATITREGSQAEQKSANIAAFHDSASAMSSEPDAMSVPTLGAVASSGADPAARKGGRSTTRISSRVPTTSSVASSEFQSIGATSASNHEDPASRKAPRTTRTSAASAVVDLNLEPMNVEEPKLDVAMTSSYASSNNRAQPSNHGDVESVPDVKPGGLLPPPPVPQPPPSTSYAAPPMGTTPAIPTPEETRDQYASTDNQLSPPQEQESFASTGPGIMSPAVDGGDAVGIQAYVAEGTDEVVVGATHVVTEDEIALEEEKKQTRLLRIGGIICCLLLIAIIVPIAIVVPENKVIVDVSESPSMAPSSSPTVALLAELLGVLQPLYPDQAAFQAAFASTDTPQYQAAEWAANNPPTGVTSASDPRMISRYALATFYYSTNGADWVRCGVGSTNCDTGREWLTAENECDWLAVECVDPDGGDYTVQRLFFRPLDIDGNNIAGILPFEVALLSDLDTIILSKQAIQGSIPEGWSSLTKLSTFIIGSNQLTGTFPDFLFFENSLLGTLYLSTNKLSGSLPATASSALLSLRVDQNSFTGPIPAAYGAFRTLQELLLNNNELTGSVPEELYNLSTMRIINLSNNTGLTGTISESITNFQNLTTLRISNTGMTGSLPLGLFDLANLQFLDLSINSFTGSLPSEFANLTTVKEIALNNNTFAGPVTDGFDNLSVLGTLALQANSLTGTISSTLCSRVGDSLLDLKTLTADCSEVTCSCCTECY